MIIGTGTFSPGENHVMKGTFTLTRQDDGSVFFETSEDFFFDGSPEPGWALYTGVPQPPLDGALEATMERTKFGTLPGGPVTTRIPVEGRRTATMPTTTDIDDYDTIVLWCFRFPFILGVGPIEREN